MAVLTCIFAIICIAARHESARTFVASSGAMTLVIDAGHGGLDGGAVSESGIKESDVNLAIALKLRDISLLCGVECVMTRQDENSVNTDSGDTIRQQKVTDMRNRVEMIGSIPNALLVSIHQNSYPGASRGAQVFYRDKDEFSRKLAVKIQEEIEYVNSQDKSRNVMPVPDGIYLFKNTDCSAVLVECGFLSSAEDVKLLESESYRINTALGIMSAVLGTYDFEELQ